MNLNVELYPSEDISGDKRCSQISKSQNSTISLKASIRASCLQNTFFKDSDPRETGFL